MSNSTAAASLPPDVILSGRYEAGIIVLTVISVAVVWLRLYTRIFITRETGWDDWLMLVASLVAILDNAFLLAAYHYGLGRHIEYLSPNQISSAFMWLWAGEPTNLFAVYLVRVSISLFFLRLIPPHRKFYVRLIWIVIGSLTVADIYVSSNYFAECRPIQKIWKPEINGSCFSTEVLAAAPWFYQGISIVGDVVILTIPVLLFQDLQVPRRAKIALIGILCLGFFTCVCAIVKTVLLTNLFSANPDKTWNLAQLVLWASLEMCVGMICGSIPALRPLFISIKAHNTHRGYTEHASAHDIAGYHSQMHSGNASQANLSGGLANMISSSSEGRDPSPKSGKEFIEMSDQSRIRATTEVDVSVDLA